MRGMQVKSTRKGLTNQLKTLLWRKPSTGSAVSMPGRDSPLSGSVHGGSVHGGAANGGLTAYSGASIESQMRSLADLAFLMQVLCHRRASMPCVSCLLMHTQELEMHACCGEFSEVDDRLLMSSLHGWLCWQPFAASAVRAFASMCHTNTVRGLGSRKALLQMTFLRMTLAMHGNLQNSAALRIRASVRDCAGL